MGSMPVQLDRPPAPPADVQAQQGGAGGLMDRIKAALAARMQGGAPAAPTAPAQAMANVPPGVNAMNPQGAFLAQSQQVEQLLTQMAKGNDKFAPWAQRMIAVLRAGTGEIVGSTPAPGAAAEPGSSMEAPGGSTTATGTAKAPTGPLNSGFPG